MEVIEQESQLNTLARGEVLERGGYLRRTVSIAINSVPKPPHDHL